MNPRTTLYNETQAPKTATLSIISPDKEKEQTEILLFHKQLADLKEATNRLSFMISEIHFVLENSPKARRQA